jgi:hypothetical protein
VQIICDAINLQAVEQYQMGKTKVISSSQNWFKSVDGRSIWSNAQIFCRTGLIGRLEAQRTETISLAVTGIQKHCRYVVEQRSVERKKKLM